MGGEGGNRARMETGTENTAGTGTLRAEPGHRARWKRAEAQLRVPGARWTLTAKSSCLRSRASTGRSAPALPHEMPFSRCSDSPFKPRQEHYMLLPGGIEASGAKTRRRWQGTLRPPAVPPRGSSPPLAFPLCAASSPTPCRGSSSRELSEASNVPAAAAPAPLPPGLTQGQAASWHSQPRELLRDLIFKALPTSPGTDLGGGPRPVTAKKHRARPDRQ